MADARLGLGPIPPAPQRYERVNEQAFRQQMDSLRRSVEQYVASSRNTLEAELTAHGISDLADVEITSVASGELLAFDGDDWINRTLAEAGIAAASHQHAAADIVSGTLANARISEASVTQHQAALSLTESQISDLDHYVDADADARIALATLADLATASASDIDSGTLADARLSANVPLLDAANVFTAQQKVDGIETGLLVEHDADGDDAFIAINSGDQPTQERAGFVLQHGGITRYQFISQNHPSADAIFQIRQFDGAGTDAGGFLSFRQDLNRLFLGAGNNGVQVGASSSNVAFYGGTPVAKQTSVAVSAAGIHAALVNLGLIAGP